MRSPLSPSMTVAALLLGGCGDSGASSSSTPLPTLVAVSPTDFLEDAECEADEASPHSYVATLYEISGAEGGVGELVLPSSGPVSCRLPVAFSFVVPGARYVAAVQLYTEAPSALAPFAPGSSVMVDAAGRPVAPLRELDCGRPASSVNGGVDGGVDGGAAGGGAYARSTTTVYVRHCAARPKPTAP